MKKIWINVILTVFSMAFAAPTFAQSKAYVRGNISQLSDTTHLEFEGLKTWNYELKKSSPNTAVLTIPAFDSTTIARLRGFSDPMVKSVTINTKGPDRQYIVTFVLADSKVESFDYLTDEPSRLIIDFYRKSRDEARAPETGPRPGRISRKKKPTRVAHRRSRKAAVAKRSPAGDEILSIGSEQKASPIDERFGVFDAADKDYDRFRVKDYEIHENAILAARHNVYLPFPILKMPMSRLDVWAADEPEYVIKPKNSKENQEARLLLVLYKRKRINLFLKTFPHFQKHFPDSNYMEILKNIYAQIFLDKWRQSKNTKDFEEARDTYAYLVDKFLDSPLYQRNRLIISYMDLERGDAFATIQDFEGFIKKFPKSSEVLFAEGAIAASYGILHKWDDAIAEYGKIIKDFPETDNAREAKYRLGDVYYESGDLKKALAAYDQAEKNDPKGALKYPNLHYNKAEALFWLKDYKNALNEYIEFIKDFPTHEHGAYAITRIGELMNIFGTDPRRSMGAFLEAYFRFPHHPGAKVARLRMLSQQMKGMKEKELKRALEEVNKIVKSIDIPGAEEFGTLLVASGMRRRGDYQRALKELISYYQKHPSTADKALFHERIERNIAGRIRQFEKDGKFLDALKFKEKYSKTWLTGSNRMDIPYFEAKAYEQAGAYQPAEKIYKDVLARRVKITGSQEEKERRVHEYLPDTQSLRLRLAAVSEAQREYTDAFQYLRDIDHPQKLSPAEQIENARLRAEVSEYQGDWASAKKWIKELMGKWKNDKKMLAPLDVKLAELNLKTRDYDQALQRANEALKNSELSDGLAIRALKTKAQCLLNKKQELAAVDVYQELLDRFENKKPMGSIRYKVGELLFKHGDLQGAQKVWDKLKGSEDDVLYNLAKERLAEASWKDQYQKYIDRIPAMAEASKRQETSK